MTSLHQFLLKTAEYAYLQQPTSASARRELVKAAIEDAAANHPDRQLRTTLTRARPVVTALA
jgi:hypothetical protein